ncbi:MAG: Integral membrane protein, partial [uncultured Blastococcus sp.]
DPTQGCRGSAGHDRAGGRAAAAQRAAGPLGQRRGLPPPPAGHRRRRGGRRVAAGGVAVDPAGFTAVLRIDPRGRRHVGGRGTGVRAAAPGTDVRARGPTAPAGAHAGRLRGRRVRGLLCRGAGRPADPRARAGDQLGAQLRRPGIAPARAHHHAGQRSGGGGVLPRCALRGSGRAPAGARVDRGVRAGHDRDPQPGARAGERAHGAALRPAAQDHRRNPGADADARGVVGPDAALPAAPVRRPAGGGAAAVVRL